VDRLKAGVQGDDGIARYGRNDMHGIVGGGQPLPLGKEELLAGWGENAGEL